MKYFVGMLLLLLCFVFLLYLNNTNRVNNNLFIIGKEQFLSEEYKPYLWFYWENKPGKVTPDYIKLCEKSIMKHCSNSFNVIKLNEKNIYDYLPELLNNNINTDNLLLAQKVDYYRILLLYKYGGLYLDADTLVMRNPYEIIEKLKYYDYIGFGCTGITCTYGYGRPSNGIMASRPNGELVTRILTNIENKLRNNNGQKWDYFDLGKYIIWSELDYLINNKQYIYYHYSNDFDGTRDINGNWIETSYLFSDKPINYRSPNDLMFIILYNSQMDDIRDLSEYDILNSNTNISKFIKKSLDI